MGPEEETPLKQIRTFQGDIAEALQKQQESLVSIQRAEHLRRSSVGTSDDTSALNNKTRKESFLLIFGSLLLFALGIAGAWFGYNEFVRKTTTPVTAVPASRFLSPNQETNLDIAPTSSREILINTLFDASSNVAPGELRHIVLRKVTETDKPLLTTGEFLNILETRAPSSLLRAFDPLFMFGSLGKSSFLIIRLASFENAFAGMLVWEKNLAEDLGPLFATAPLLKNITPESVFTDVTDRNKDIRTLVIEGETILLYSFFDNNMLIITDSIETLRTIIDRLTREKLSR